jgi:hypothetical protein
VRTFLNFVRFEVLTAVLAKGSIFWSTSPCSPVKVSQSFGGTLSIFIVEGQAKQDNQLEADIRFFRNVGWLSPDYTALYRRRQNSSFLNFYIFLDCFLLLHCALHVGSQGPILGYPCPYASICSFTSYLFSVD